MAYDEKSSAPNRKWFSWHVFLITFSLQAKLPTNNLVRWNELMRRDALCIGCLVSLQIFPVIQQETVCKANLCVPVERESTMQSNRFVCPKLFNRGSLDSLRHSRSEEKTLEEENVLPGSSLTVVAVSWYVKMHKTASRWKRFPAVDAAIGLHIQPDSAHGPCGLVLRWPFQVVQKDCFILFRCPTHFLGFCSTQTLSFLEGLTLKLFPGWGSSCDAFQL